MIREKLLEFVKCTDCLAPLVAWGERGLVCLNPECRRKYDIFQGTIPNMLLEESEVLGEAAWRGVLDETGAKPCEAGAAPPKRRKKPRAKSG